MKCAASTGRSSSTEYARGAYTSYFPPGVQSEPAFWQAYSAPGKLPGLFVAGADYYAGKGYGYMKGAVRSGEQAANVMHNRRTANVKQAKLRSGLVHSSQDGGIATWASASAW